MMGGEEPPPPPAPSAVTLPLVPKLGLGWPLLALTDTSPPPSPQMICGGVFLSPGQYSRPRVDPWPSTLQISLPVVASNATTLRYGVGRYITPSTAPTLRCAVARWSRRSHAKRRV